MFNLSDNSSMAAGMRTLREDFGAKLSRGAIAGLVAGFGFVLAEMYYAKATGLPAIAPFLAFSTVFNASAQPVLAAPAIPLEFAEGLVAHIILSLGFGMSFGIFSAFLPNRKALAIGAIGFGLALFILNFEILGRTVFPFFTAPNGPDNVFQGFIHPLIFGGLLIPFFWGAAARRRTVGGGGARNGETEVPAALSVGV